MSSMYIYILATKTIRYTQELGVFYIYLITSLFVETVFSSTGQYIECICSLFICIFDDIIDDLFYICVIIFK